MPLISVIVPIYKTEPFVEKCLRSIMAQTLQAIEILCVDDCSPDDSAQIVETLAGEDDRIRLIRHDRNLGLGGARNTGIAAARAPFLASVDSDDYILPEMMERLWAGTDDQAADIVVCGMTMVDNAGITMVDNAGKTLLKISPKPGRHLNNQDQMDIFKIFNPSFCNKLWRRSLFTDHGIRFPERTYYEDLATTPRVLRHATDIRVIPDNLYRYVYRDSSITNTTSEKHIVDYFKCYNILQSFLLSEELMERYRQEFAGAIGRSLFYHSKSVVTSSISEDEKAEYLRHMLMLKIGFLEHGERLGALSTAELQELIQSATCHGDLRKSEHAF